ncbi:MAG: hypothetical protein ABSG03_37145, partial [Bryobacteraceae bacterium]
TIPSLGSFKLLNANAVSGPLSGQTSGIAASRQDGLVFTIQIARLIGIWSRGDAAAAGRHR